jgi:hypothetical protein
MGEVTDPDAPAAEVEDSATDYDLYSWAVSLGVSVEALRRAIAEVGDGAAAVRRRLAET